MAAHQRGTVRIKIRIRKRRGSSAKLPGFSKMTKPRLRCLNLQTVGRPGRTDGADSRFWRSRLRKFGNIWISPELLSLRAWQSNRKAEASPQNLRRRAETVPKYGQQWGWRVDLFPKALVVSVSALASFFVLSTALPAQVAHTEQLQVKPPLLRSIDPPARDAKPEDLEARGDQLRTEKLYLD